VGKKVLAWSGNLRLVSNFRFYRKPERIGQRVGRLQRGDLLSTTYAGGSYASGPVFDLIPSNESWTERVLYSFTGGSDGAYPLAGVIDGPSGHLYGTSFGGGYGQGLQGDGVVFEVVP
jgi:hypothetical protein